MASTIEFKDILLGSTLPLHPYLIDHPRLSLRLILDGKRCQETPVVNGDLSNGIWEINSELRAHQVEHSITLAIVATLAIVRSPKILKFQFVSVTISVAELLERVKAQPNGYHTFHIGDSCSSIQLIMTCSIKALPSLVLHNPPSHVGTHDTDHTVDNRTENTHSSHKLDNSGLPSREDLESAYANITRIPDRDERKSRGLSRLGLAYSVYYQETGAKADLERAIVLHDEAMQFTRPFHPQWAEHAQRLSIVLSSRFQKSRNTADIQRAISCLQTALSLTDDLDADKLTRLSDLGTAFQLRFECLSNLTDLEDGLSNLRQAVQITPDGHPDKPGQLGNLGRALVSRFELLGDLTDLEDGLSTLWQAVQITPDGHPYKPGQLGNLARALVSRFEWLGDLTDLEDAISNFRQAVQFTPDGCPDKPGRLDNLGRALQSRFRRLGGLSDLEDAVSTFKSAVELVPDGHPEKPSHLNNLGAALRFHFARLGGLSDLEDAISNQRKAVELTPDGHPKEPRLLTNLGDALQCRFLSLGILTDLEDAISNNRKAVDLSPDGHPSKPNHLNSLGTALLSRFERLGGLTDLEDAISNNRKAIDLSPDGHPDKPDWLTDLGNALLSRFKRLGILTDLDDAISNHEKAVNLSPDSHPEKPRQLNNLGLALLSRFERLGGLTDLEDAISNTRKAVDLSPDGHPEKPSRLSSLGSVLPYRFRRLGILKDLEDAISNNRKAVDLTPEGHPRKPGCLNNLGNVLQIRFARLGGLSDLEDAISNQRKAVELTPDGHPSKPRFLTNLGGALQCRFLRLGILTDLEDALSNNRKAVDFSPDGHPSKPRWLSNLGNALQYRFSCLGILTDLEGAIWNYRKAVNLSPDGHPDKPDWLTNLGNALLSRFERLGILKDLEDAISNNRKAVNLSPDGHPEKPAKLNNLGCALQCRFSRLTVFSDLEDAIENTRKAIDLSPDGHPEKPGWLTNLGNALQDRFSRLGILDDLESALSTFSTATNSMSGSAMIRFKTARRWAKVAEKHSRSPLHAFSCAIDLLPRIAWLGLAVTDQHALLADVGDIVRDAVAAAIRYEEYETAVVWAEQGRAIVWQNFLGLRNPVDDLREAYPELANRLRGIAEQLEGSKSHEPLGEKGQTTRVEDVSQRYSKLALEWDNLVDEIRNLPTFEGFLKAKTFRQLAPATHEGPVVILNVNDVRCDALALIVDGSAQSHVSVVNIPLERFSHEKSKRMFESLTQLLSSAGVRERNDRKTGRAQSTTDSDAKFKVILRVLWQDVVKPVIDGLAFQSESKRPPRIWWCATGLLAFLPIHAAGLYNTQEVGEKVSDYVVSSYTPTLTAILDLSDQVVRNDFRVLTVAQASAPGAPPIPNTEDEVKIVQNLVTGALVLNLTGENATVERVRDEMMQSNWIHLACHGQQNPADPMESGFLLHDRTLKLSEIVRMSLPKTDFAFLSACQTAMGDERVAEESAHLAAGMFLSGCRGVIATTWSIRDDDGPKIAQEVYSRMFKDGKPNRKEAAYALDEAVKLLRESGAPCTAWVPFIHIGR